MPITQNRNQDLEKRLSHLRAQLYGKKSESQHVSFSVNQTGGHSEVATQVADITYLHQDLLKIFILAGIAFMFQFGLYFALLKNIIHLSI